MGGSLFEEDAGSFLDEQTPPSSLGTSPSLLLSSANLQGRGDPVLTGITSQDITESSDPGRVDLGDHFGHFGGVQEVPSQYYQHSRPQIGGLNVSALHDALSSAVFHSESTGPANMKQLRGSTGTPISSMSGDPWAGPVFKSWLGRPKSLAYSRGNRQQAADPVLKSLGTCSHSNSQNLRGLLASTEQGLYGGSLSHSPPVSNNVHANSFNHTSISHHQVESGAPVAMDCGPSMERLSWLGRGPETLNSSYSATPTSYGNQQRIRLSASISSRFLDAHGYSNGHHREEMPAANRQALQDSLGAQSSFATSSERLLFVNHISSNPRQVGSSTVTGASIARRKTRRPRYFCNVPGCSSEGFTAKHNYDYHMRAHNGEKPFRCSGCERAFGSRSDLRRHGSKSSKRRCQARA
ncbi:B-cell lymphoma/leukemia 11A [Marasmius sp. AFHP31]|nr:B-cell lymphoma/leukemia 11A [Marasmius sp. AFHP31]